MKNKKEIPAPDLPDSLKFGVPKNDKLYIFVTPLGKVLTRTGYFGLCGFDEAPFDEVRLAELYMLTEKEKEDFIRLPYAKVFCQETQSRYKRKDLTPILMSVNMASIPNLKDARTGKIKSLKGEL